MSGIKESKECLVALVVLGKFIAEGSKNGIGLDDLGALIAKFVSDEKFREVLEAGVKGLEAVPAEIGELDASEALELVGLLIDALRKG